jgi:phage-related holin
VALDCSVIFWCHPENSNYARNPKNLIVCVPVANFTSPNSVIRGPLPRHNSIPSGGNQEESLADDQILDRNCSGCEQCCMDYEGWLQFQQALYRIVRDPLFELAITVCIVLNTMFLAMEHHGMSDDVLRALDVGNKVSGARDGRLEPPHCLSFQVFTSIFTFECCLKLMALSKEFFYCGWNIFDLIIVSASVLDLIFELVDGLSVLRGLRLVSEGSPPDHSDSYRVASS